MGRFGRPHGEEKPLDEVPKRQHFVGVQYTLWIIAHSVRIPPRNHIQIYNVSLLRNCTHGVEMTNDDPKTEPLFNSNISNVRVVVMLLSFPFSRHSVLREFATWGHLKKTHSAKTMMAVYQITRVYHIRNRGYPFISFV